MEKNSDLTYSLTVSIPKKISLPGIRKPIERDDFYNWLWQEFSEHGLVGVHEGTLLSEQAAEAGLETDSWTVDSGEAPRDRDWVGNQGEAQAQLFFSNKEGAENVLGSLSKISEIRLGEIETHEPQDWDAQWKASFLNAGEGVEIPPFWRVVPPWVDASSKWPGAKILKINPGAGFGTGTHETTQLCLEAIGRASTRLSLEGKTALDFGSGSGILSIGLALVGARVDAVEIDPLAVDNARENAMLNQVEKQIQFFTSLLEKERKYQIVVANILRPVLLEFRQELVKRLESGGVMILSGLIESDVASVSQAYQQLLGREPRVMERGEWRALVFG